jgi:hypothetical protein
VKQIQIESNFMSISSQHPGFRHINLDVVNPEKPAKAAEAPQQRRGLIDWIKIHIFKRQPNIEARQVSQPVFLYSVTLRIPEGADINVLSGGALSDKHFGKNVKSDKATAEFLLQNMEAYFGAGENAHLLRAAQEKSRNFELATYDFSVRYSETEKQHLYDEFNHDLAQIEGLLDQPELGLFENEYQADSFKEKMKQVSDAMGWCIAEGNPEEAALMFRDIVDAFRQQISGHPNEKIIEGWLQDLKMGHKSMVQKKADNIVEEEPVKNWDNDPSKDLDVDCINLKEDESHKIPTRRNPADDRDREEDANGDFAGNKKVALTKEEMHELNNKSMSNSPILNNNPLFNAEFKRRNTNYYQFDKNLDTSLENLNLSDREINFINNKLTPLQEVDNEDSRSDLRKSSAIFNAEEHEQNFLNIDLKEARALLQKADKHAYIINSDKNNDIKTVSSKAISPQPINIMDDEDLLMPPNGRTTAGLVIDEKGNSNSSTTYDDDSLSALSEDANLLDKEDNKSSTEKYESESSSAERDFLWDKHANKSIIMEDISIKNNNFINLNVKNNQIAKLKNHKDSFSEIPEDIIGFHASLLANELLGKNVQKSQYDEFFYYPSSNQSEDTFIVSNSGDEYLENDSNYAIESSNVSKNSGDL